MFHEETVDRSTLELLIQLQNKEYLKYSKVMKKIKDATNVFLKQQ